MRTKSPVDVLRKLWSRGAVGCLLIVSVVVHLSTVSDADECFRKFSVERRACKGRIRRHHVTSGDITSCCAKRGQGYSRELYKLNGSRSWFSCIPCNQQQRQGNTDKETVHDVIPDTHHQQPQAGQSTWLQKDKEDEIGLENDQQRRQLTAVESHSTNQVADISVAEVVGGWSNWSDWQPCSVSCTSSQLDDGDDGGGIQTRTRSCDNPVPADGGTDCQGHALEVRNCTAPPIPCPVDGGWSNWTLWSECSVSCTGPDAATAAGGEQMRYRNCDSPQASDGGRECEGPSVESQPCPQLYRPCPVDGGWSVWTEWTRCSAECGEGFQTRSRNCDSPLPEHGGRPCEGLELESMPCVTRTHCPVAGGWSEWSRLDVCSAAPCSGLQGHQTRFRTCTNPRPMFGGMPCRGRTWSAELCYNNDFCTQRVDGGWCNWSSWSQCDVISRRYRNCQCPPPVNGGSNCDGTEIEEKECKSVDSLSPDKNNNNAVASCHADGSGDERTSDDECDTESISSMETTAAE
jgi:hypothetical protein